MAVEGGDPESVIDQDEVAVDAVVPGEEYGARVRGGDRRTRGRGEVVAVVARLGDAPPALRVVAQLGNRLATFGAHLFEGAQAPPSAPERLGDQSVVARAQIRVHALEDGERRRARRVVPAPKGSVHPIEESDRDLGGRPSEWASKGSAVSLPKASIPTTSTRPAAASTGIPKIATKTAGLAPAREEGVAYLDAGASRPRPPDRRSAAPPRRT